MHELLVQAIIDDRYRAASAARRARPLRVRAPASHPGPRRPCGGAAHLGTPPRAVDPTGVMSLGR